MAGYRLPYSTTEEQNIIKFVIDNDGYTYLRGRAFWQKVEDESGIERSWQSLKEHFLKKMLPEIEKGSYEMTPEERKLFMNSLHSKLLMQHRTLLQNP